MNLLDGVSHLHQALDYHIQRHNLLTANLSHIDTPGFRPLDLAPRSGFEAALDTAMAGTDPGHLPMPGASGSRFEVVIDQTTPAGMDGNAVSVDREAVKIATNQLRYDTLASLVSQQLNGLEWAANDGRVG
ncbi:MAG: flagellar basal body rod protein FlgB [Planctomycetota bacterium]